jgi:hypothetical protein
LTALDPEEKLPPMDREWLVQVLGEAPGLSRSGDTFEVAEEHRASVYIGREGQATVVAEVVEVVLADRFVTLRTKNGTHHFFPHAAVLGFSVRPPQEEERGRAGF